MYIQAKKLDMRSSRLGVATATTPHTGLYATDEKTSTKFLVDTGACVSISSNSNAGRHLSTGYTITSPHPAPCVLSTTLPKPSVAATCDILREMEPMGVCTKPSSPWAAPLHMTPKTDGTWRPCGNYRRLNNVTEADKYPTFRTLRTLWVIKQLFLSKLDLLKGYFQVLVIPSDVQKTAITTKFGSFMFHYSTFCLKNSGATF